MRTIAATLIVAFVGIACEPLCSAAESAAGASVVEKDAMVFGFKLHYREAGKGPVVILLHGLGGDGSRWATTMDALSGSFRVIAPDLIGFGQSDKPLANYNHAMLAEFLGEFMRVIDVPKASLVGHSMGGYVSMYLAVHQPELVDRMVLLNGGGTEYRPRDPHLIRMQNSTTLDETREYFELMFYDKSRVTDQMVRDNYHRRLQAAFTISRMQEARAKDLGLVSEEEARQIAAPTLIIWGKHDRLLDASIAEELNQIIPNSRVATIEECGHIPQVEQPEQFIKRVGEFLSEGSR